MYEKMRTHLAEVAGIALAIIVVTAIIANSGFHSPLLILNGGVSLIGWVLLIWSAVKAIQNRIVGSSKSSKQKGRQ